MRPRAGGGGGGGPGGPAGGGGGGWGGGGGGGAGGGGGGVGGGGGGSRWRRRASGGGTCRCGRTRRAGGRVGRRRRGVRARRRRGRSHHDDYAVFQRPLRGVRRPRRRVRSGPGEQFVGDAPARRPPRRGPLRRSGPRGRAAPEHGHKRPPRPRAAGGLLTPGLRGRDPLARCPVDRRPVRGDCPRPARHSTPPARHAPLRGRCAERHVELRQTAPNVVDRAARYVAPTASRRCAIWHRGDPRRALTCRSDMTTDISVQGTEVAPMRDPCDQDWDPMPRHRHPYADRRWGRPHSDAWAEFWSGWWRGPAPRPERGVVRYLILDAIRAQPRHGYEIIQAIVDKSRGAYRPSPGVVYPTLQMLEELQHARAVMQEERKAYAITESGEADLKLHDDDVADFYGSNEGSAWETPAEDVARVMKRIGMLIKAFRRGAQHGHLGPRKMRTMLSILDQALDKLQQIVDDE